MGGRGTDQALPMLVALLLVVGMIAFDEFRELDRERALCESLLAEQATLADSVAVTRKHKVCDYWIGSDVD